MKTLFIFFSLIVISFVAFAQKTTYGLTVGVNVGTIQGSAQGTGTTHTSSSHVSSLVEGFADFRFGSFSLQPAIALTGKGGNVSTGFEDEGQFALHYLQIPINLLYHVPTAAGDIFLGGGPYLAFGTGGTLSVNGRDGAALENVTFGGTGDFSNNDSGIDMLGGIQFKSGFLFRLSYDLGLANILNSQGAENTLGSLKTHTLGISAGYAF